MEQQQKTDSTILNCNQCGWRGTIEQSKKDQKQFCICPKCDSDLYSDDEWEFGFN